MTEFTQEMMWRFYKRFLQIPQQSLIPRKVAEHQIYFADVTYFSSQYLQRYTSFLASAR